MNLSQLKDTLLVEKHAGCQLHQSQMRVDVLLALVEVAEKAKTMYVKADSNSWEFSRFEAYATALGAALEKLEAK